jgi:HEAT repeat protein
MSRWRRILHYTTLLSAIALVGCVSTAEEKRRAEEAYRRAFDSARLQYASPYWIDRRNAVTSMARFRTPDAEEFIREATADSHSRVRIEAVRSLAGFTTWTSIEQLSALYKQDTSSSVRLECIIALGRMRATGAVPAFMDACEHADWMMREAGISGLLAIDHRKIPHIQRDYALRALADDSMPVRMACLKALPFRHPSVHAILRKEILSEYPIQRPVYQAALLRALTGYPVDDELSGRLKLLLTDPNRDIRINALRALKEAGAEKNPPFGGFRFGSL